MFQRPRHRRRGKGGQRRGPVRRRQPADRLYGEVVAIQRLGRRCIEPWIVEQRVQHGRLHPPARRQRAIRIEAGAGFRLHPAIDQAVGRAGVERDQPAVRSHPGDVRHPAQVQHRHRQGQPGGECRVIDRQQRRALPARRDIGRTKVPNRGDARRIRQRGAVADLPCPAAIGPVGHRLPVKADHPNIVGRHPGIAQQLLHRQHMGAHDQVTGRHHRRARPRLVEGQRQHRGLGQLRARRVGIGLAPGRDRPHLSLAIGFDQRGIDPVERGPGHQTDREHGQAFPFPPVMTGGAGKVDKPRSRSLHLEKSAGIAYVRAIPWQPNSPPRRVSAWCRSAVPRTWSTANAS